jgi:hypothetical protein
MNKNLLLSRQVFQKKIITGKKKEGFRGIVRFLLSCGEKDKKAK